jgi:hydroxycarboxylate dehydrogenase B
MTAAAQASRSDGVTTDICISHNRLRPFVQEIFAAAGSSAEEARIVSDHLVDANLKGHDSHGAIRAAKYVDGFATANSFPTSTLP